MDEIIKEELRDGEKVLWFGAPENFETLDRTHKNPLIKNAVRIMAVVVALCVIYVVYALTNGIELKPVLVVLALIFAIMGAASGFLQGKKMKRVKYAITDQRIISVLELPKSLEYSKIKEVCFETDADGHTSILFGEKAIKAKAHQRRSIALLDPYIDEETGFCSRFALYAVPEAEKLKEILEQYVAI